MDRPPDRGLKGLLNHHWTDSLCSPHRAVGAGCESVHASLLATFHTTNMKEDQ